MLYDIRFWLLVINLVILSLFYLIVVVLSFGLKFGMEWMVMEFYLVLMLRDLCFCGLWLWMSKVMLCLFLVILIWMEMFEIVIWFMFIMVNFWLIVICFCFSCVLLCEIFVVVSVSRFLMCFICLCCFFLFVLWFDCLCIKVDYLEWGSISRIL